jgi:geranylgeranyl pyrophosphate synthase
LLRGANHIFEEPEIRRLSPRLRQTGPSGEAGNDPIAVTESIGYDWLVRGGKRLRPFVTLASYDALKGGECSRLDPDRGLPKLPDAVCRAAMAIEAFHKASLVHDDIEDDDAYRYGRETLHRKHGTPTAINVGDYLIGLGGVKTGSSISRRWKRSRSTRSRPLPRSRPHSMREFAWPATPKHMPP